MTLYKTPFLKALRFDLHKPCADCPFRRDVRPHEGVARDLSGTLDAIEGGVFAHTCHKTDPRSDSPVGQAADGPAQHCAGALLMVLRTTNGIVDQEPMARAVGDGRLDLAQLDWRAADNVHTGTSLVHAYDAFTRALIRQHGERTIRKVKHVR